MKKIHTVLIAALLLAVSLPLKAQNKPIWIIAPYAPGGGVDIYARLLSQELTQLMGRQVSVENKPGASGTIGSDYVAKSPPDGHMFMLNTNAFVINASVYKSLPFDPIKDLVPVSILGTVPVVIAVHASVPAHSVAELVAATKQKDSKYAYSSCGSGTSHHLAGEMFKLVTGADMVHVPYKGCGPAIADVAAGQVQVGFNTIAAALPFVQAGKLRILTLTTAKRSVLAPNLPSAAESGLPNFNVDQWFGLFAPGRTPRDIIDRMNAVIAKAFAREEFRNKLIAQGIDPSQSTHEEAMQTVRADLERWGKLARELNLKLD